MFGEPNVRISEASRLGVKLEVSRSDNVHSLVHDRASKLIISSLNAPRPEKPDSPPSSQKTAAARHIGITRAKETDLPVITYRKYR
jgi:hypothetical protein